MDKISFINDFGEERFSIKVVFFIGEQDGDPPLVNHF